MGGLGFLFGSTRLLWCHSTRPEHEGDPDPYDKYYLPLRPICSLQPGRDRIVLPRHPHVEAFARLACRILGIKRSDIFWTSGRNFLLDYDISEELSEEIRRLVMGGGWTLVPYSVTDPFIAWRDKLETPYLGDGLEWVNRYNRKGILHPPLTGLDTAARGTALGIRTPRGYTCSNTKELLLAYDRLRTLGVETVMLKPSLSTSGDGIVANVTPDQLRQCDFSRFDGFVVEEELPIDRDDTGSPIVPSVQFIGGHIAAVTGQDLMGFGHKGNTGPARITTQVKAQVCSMTKVVLDEISPMGPGGLDFLVSGGEAYLIDPNLGRFTGCSPAWMFAHRYAPQSCFHSWQRVPSQDPETFWTSMQKEGIAFNPQSPRRGGVFPLCHLQDMWGLYIALGQDHEEVEALRRKASELF